MDFEEFSNSLSLQSPPQALPVVLKALWYEKNNRWKEAHDTVHDEQGFECALVHAYLHRKEGDQWNARYWYKIAGRRPFVGSFEAEWEEIARLLLLEDRELRKTPAPKTSVRSQLQQDS